MKTTSGDGRIQRAQLRLQLRLQRYDAAVGPCPHCGAREHRYEGIPLTAVCAGSSRTPHKVWTQPLPRHVDPFGDVLPVHATQKEGEA